MELELGRSYLDRQGKTWKIVSVENGQNETVGPCTGARWEGKRYITRLYRRDGTDGIYPPWDLIRPVETQPNHRKRKI